MVMLVFTCAVVITAVGVAAAVAAGVVVVEVEVEVEEVVEGTVHVGALGAALVIVVPLGVEGADFDCERARGSSTRTSSTQTSSSSPSPSSLFSTSSLVGLEEETLRLL